MLRRSNNDAGRPDLSFVIVWRSPTYARRWATLSKAPAHPIGRAKPSAPIGLTTLFFAFGSSKPEFDIFRLRTAVHCAGANGTITTVIVTNVPLSRLILRCC